MEDPSQVVEERLLFRRRRHVAAGKNGLANGGRHQGHTPTVTCREFGSARRKQQVESFDDREKELRANAARRAAPTLGGFGNREYAAERRVVVVKGREWLDDVIDKPGECDARRVGRKRLFVNTSQIVGVPKGQRGQHRIAVGKELVERAFRGVRFERNGLGGRALHALSHNNRRGGVEQQIDSALSTRLTGLAPERRFGRRCRRIGPRRKGRWCGYGG